jgi:hypothetical protein
MRFRRRGSGLEAGIKAGLAQASGAIVHAATLAILGCM